MTGDFSCTGPDTRPDDHLHLANLDAGATASITVTYPWPPARPPIRPSTTPPRPTPMTGGADDDTDQRGHHDPCRRGRRQGRQPRSGHRRQRPDLHHHRHQRRPVRCPGRQPSTTSSTGPDRRDVHRSVNGGPASAAAPWTGTLGLGTLEPGDSVVIVISATVDPATPEDTTSTTRPTPRRSTDDPNPANNSYTETTHGRRPRPTSTSTRPLRSRPPPVIRPASTTPSASTTTARRTTPVASPSATRWRAA